MHPCDLCYRQPPLRSSNVTLCMPHRVQLLQGKLAGSSASVDVAERVMMHEELVALYCVLHGQRATAEHAIRLCQMYNEVACTLMDTSAGV